MVKSPTKILWPRRKISQTDATALFLLVTQKIQNKRAKISRKNVKKNHFI